MRYFKEHYVQKHGITIVLCPFVSSKITKNTCIKMWDAILYLQTFHILWNIKEFDLMNIKIKVFNNQEF